MEFEEQPIMGNATNLYAHISKDTFFGFMKMSSMVKLED